MTFGKRAYQRVLHEIVRPVGGSCERPRIAAESGDLAFNKTTKLRHSPYPLRPRNPGLMDKNVCPLCNPSMNGLTAFSKKM